MNTFAELGTSGEEAGGVGNERAKSGLPFDPRRLIAAVLMSWRIVFISGALMGLLAFGGAFLKFKTKHEATGHLMKQESAATVRATELGDPFKPRQISVPTLVGLAKSPSVAQRVSAVTQVPARNIMENLVIKLERNTDLINLNFTTTRSPQTAVRVLNAFGNEVVKLTKELQTQEASEMNRVLKTQVERAEEELRGVNEELVAFSRDAGLVDADKEISAYLRSLGELDIRYETTKIEYETIDLKIAGLEKELTENNPVADRLRAARMRLQELAQQYTETNPLVADQRDAVEQLEKNAAEAKSQPLAAPRIGELGVTVGLYSDLVHLRSEKQVAKAGLEKLKLVRAGLDEKLRALPEKGVQLARIKARQQSLETARLLLAGRQREAQIYEENPGGYYRLFEAQVEDVETKGRTKMLLLTGSCGVFLGMLGAAILFAIKEMSDDRIKTTADHRRAVDLPLLAALPDLKTLDAVGQFDWSFRSWLALKPKLSAGTNREIVAGFVASYRNEGCSTLLELFSRAIAEREQPAIIVCNSPPANEATTHIESALTDPGIVPALSKCVRWITLPHDWRWTTERRKRWQLALDAWKKSSGVVVLIELPAAEQPETVLFAEQLPQLIWVSRAGEARASGTIETLKTLRNAGCRFVGSIFNAEKRLLPWL